MADGSRLRIPQSTAATLDATVLAEGEIRHDTTNDEVRIGDGSTMGGKILISAGAYGASRIGVPWIDPSWAAYGADRTGAADASDEIILALAAAESAKRPTLIAGAYLIGATSIAGDNIHFTGFAGPEALYPYTDSPSQFRITNTSNNPFKIGETVALDRITTLYPNQVDTTSPPISYPAMFVNENNTTQATGFRLENFTVLGATDIAELGGLDTYEVAGYIRCNFMSACWTRYAFNLTHVPERMQFTCGLWGYNVYADEVLHYGSGGAAAILDVEVTRSGATATYTTKLNGSPVAHGLTVGRNVTVTGFDQANYNITDGEVLTVPTSSTFTATVDTTGSPASPGTGSAPKCHVFTLRDYIRDNAIWMRFWGDGEAATISSVSVDGGDLVNQFWYGIKSVFEGAADPDGGALGIINGAAWTIDGVQHLVKCPTGSTVRSFHVTGLVGYQFRIADPTWFGYLIDVEDPPPNDDASASFNMTIANAEMGFMRGGIASLVGDHIDRFALEGFSCDALCHTTENGDRNAVYLDCPNADIQLHMGHAKASSVATGTRTFVNIVNARSVDVTGTFDGWDHVIKNESATCKVSFNGKTFNDGDDAITGSYAGNVKVSLDSAIESMPTVSQPAGDNALINPAFDIWQRGTSFAAGAIAYTADRWKFTRASAATGATLSRQTGFSGAQFCARLARDNGNGGTGALYLAQQIETSGCHYLQGMDLFVGFDARKGADFSASGSTLTVTVFTGTGSNETVNVATGFATGGASTSKTATLSTTAGRFVLGPFAIPATATEIAVVVSWTPTGTASTANDYAELTHFSVGTLATAQEYHGRAFRDEVDRCEAYYEKNLAIGTAPAQNLGNGGQRFRAVTAGATDNGVCVSFRVRKRTTPTVTLYNPNAANAQIRDVTASADFSSSTANVITQTSFQASGTANASTNAGNQCEFHWSADAEIGP